LLTVITGKKARYAWAGKKGDGEHDKKGEGSSLHVVEPKDVVVEPMEGEETLSEDTTAEKKGEGW
jgi:hypothetical protein